jgi:hypothetical protein
VTRRHIAILWHERDRHRDLARYAITHLAECWRADGHHVRFMFGTERFEGADIVVVHVDVSVVPARYLEFAARFPISVNGRVQDIRRTRFSRILVRRDEAYTGPVIVKSNANHAGAPERARSSLGLATLRWRLRRRLATLHRRTADAAPIFVTPLDYRIFDRASHVPEAWFDNRELVVERFLPERVGECYAVRNYQFLGDRWTCSRMLALDPIVNAYTQIGTEPVDLHPEIEALRQELGFDYGKFDYVVHDGRPVLLDANKTTGAAGLPLTPELVAARRYRAEGLYSFFAQPVAV